MIAFRRLATAGFLFAPVATHAAQSSYTVPTSGPLTMSQFVGTYLNPALSSLAGQSSGSTAPTNGPSGAPVLFQTWADTSTSPATIRMYDGAQWVAVGTLNATTHAYVPQLPAPTTSTRGGALDASAPSNQFQTGSVGGVPQFMQPSFGNLLGTASASQLSLACLLTGCTITGSQTVSGTLQVGTGSNPVGPSQVYLGTAAANGGPTPIGSSTTTQRLLANVETYGTFEQAAAWSVIANYGSGVRTGVAGFQTTASLTTDYDRDSAAFFYSNGNPAPVATATGATTFTALTVTVPTAFTAAQLASFQPGMIIDTSLTGGSKYSCIMVSWTPTTITVKDGWFLVGTNTVTGNQATGQIPPNGLSVIVSPITKIWGTNGFITLSTAGLADRGVDHEGDLYNVRKDYGVLAATCFYTDVACGYMAGIDMVDLGTYPSSAHFISRGGPYYGYMQMGSRQAAYYAGIGAGNPTPVVAFEAVAQSIPFAALSSSFATLFQVNSAGLVQSTAGFQVPGYTGFQMQNSSNNFTLNTYGSQIQNAGNIMYIDNYDATSIQFRFGAGTPATKASLTSAGLFDSVSFSSGGTLGVTCSAAPGASFTTKNGIVTHC